MMSAAILMTAGAEQVGAPPPASSDLFSDQGEPEGISFAKSFNERVGDSALSQGKSSAGEVSTVLPSLKGAAFAKKTEEIVDIPTGMKGKTIAAQEIPAHGELKSAVGGKIAQAVPTAMTRSQEETTVGDSVTKEVEPPALVENTADDVSVAPRGPDATPIAGLTDGGLMRFVKITDEDAPLISNVGGPVVQKETDTAEKEKEIGSTKKTAKPQESSAIPKTIQKTNGTAVNTIAVGTKPAVESLAEGAIPVMGQAIATGVVTRNVIGKTMGDLSESVSGPAKPSVEVAPGTADGSVRTESARGVKVTVAEPEIAGVVTNDQGVLSKPDIGLEKIAAVAVLTSSQGDNKTQSASELVTGSVHLMSGGVGILPGIASVVAPGNTPGDLIAAKIPVEIESAHITGLHIGSREQDGPGLVAASMDGMPRMLTATPTALEVGIQNGTHGWLKVRAEMADGGVVNASVSAASSTGQEMLHRELPALTAYLQQEKVAVNTVVIHTTVAAGVESKDSGAGMNGGGGGQTPQKSNEGGEQRQNVGRVGSDRSDEAMGYQEVGEDGSLPLANYAGGGSWLSVRA